LFVCLKNSQKCIDSVKQQQIDHFITMNSFSIYSFSNRLNIPTTRQKEKKEK